MGRSPFPRAKPVSHVADSVRSHRRTRPLCAAKSGRPAMSAMRGSRGWPAQGCPTPLHRDTRQARCNTRTAQSRESANVGPGLPRRWGLWGDSGVAVLGIGVGLGVQPMRQLLLPGRSHQECCQDCSDEPGEGEAPALPGLPRVPSGSLQPSALRGPCVLQRGTNPLHEGTGPRAGNLMGRTRPRTGLAA